MKQLVVRVKQNTSEELKKKVVYQVAYNDCKKVHIDETKRTLKIRVSEQNKLQGNEMRRMG